MLLSLNMWIYNLVLNHTLKTTLKGKDQMKKNLDIWFLFH